MPKGLYVHIPFCKTRCHYCNFVSTPNAAATLRARFFKALKLEISEAARRYGRLSFNALYVGGGTPSFLNRQEIGILFELLRGHLAFKKDAEMTCEWNPGDSDEENLTLFRTLGINRISLGAQSFQEHLLQRLGRRHSVKDILITFEKIRQAGIENISLDLMLRIPGQTLKDFRGSLKRSVELGAEQISLYDLEVHARTIFGEWQEQGKLNLPSEEGHAAMYQEAIHILRKAGYEHYEISNFAKPGFASRHNLLYWHNQEYIGLGPGAFSYLRGVRFQFAENLESYLQKCEEGYWENAQEDTLSGEEKEAETFIMGLRLKEGVIPENFPQIYPQLKKRIETLCSENLLRQHDRRVVLSDRGKFLSEDVFAFLLQKDKLSLNPAVS